MIGSGRKKSIAFFIALGAGLILVALLLYLGGVVLNWRDGIRVFFGILLLACRENRAEALYQLRGFLQNQRDCVLGHFDDRRGGGATSYPIHPLIAYRQREIVRAGS